MYIIWRYIVKEHISPFLFGLGILTLVFLLNLIFRELGSILSRGLGFSIIAEFFILNLAWILALAIPMAVLVATLMAFGRLSGDGEITAMKASGISIIYMIIPIFIMSILLTLFLIWFNNHILPDANYRTKLLWGDIARKRPTLQLEAGVVYKDLDDYSILVEEIRETPDTAYVKNISIEDNSDPKSSTYIFAERGKIYLNRQTGMLHLMLFDGEMHELDIENMQEYRTVQFPKQMQTIAVPEMILRRSDKGSRGDREKSAGMMRAEIEEYRTRIREHKNKQSQLIQTYFQDMLPRGGSQHDQQDSITLTREKILKTHQQFLHQLQSMLSTRNIEHMKRNISKLSVEVQKKYSIPVACIIFVLVGAPLGIMARRGNMAVAGGIAFAFFLLYWSTLIGGEELADHQYVSPFTAMWTANIICGIGGFYLIFHSIHETTFINWSKYTGLFKKLNVFSRDSGKS